MENLPCEIFMNETKFETNLMDEENPDIQTQENVVIEDEIDIKKLQLEKLMNQRKNWKCHNWITFFWFFLCEW